METESNVQRKKINVMNSKNNNCREPNLPQSQNPEQSKRETWIARTATTTKAAAVAAAAAAKTLSHLQMIAEQNESDQN